MSYYAIIAGAGAGTGRSVALRFFQASYSVVLLSRSASSYQPIVDELNSKAKTPSSSGGAASAGASGDQKAIGIAADVTDAASMDAAFRSIREQLGSESRLAAAVYNANMGFALKPFLETTAEDLETATNGSTRGLFQFAQHVLPGLVATADAAAASSSSSSSQQGGNVSPTLIVTGATASVKGSSKFGTFAAGKFAQRGMAQSIAREFGPRGVHVALALIDGLIDTPRTQGYAPNDGMPDGKLNADAIAESYYQLHRQHRSAWTHELDLRPYCEKF